MSEKSHRGFPLAIVKPIHEEHLETGKLYAQKFLIGVVPPDERYPLTVAFGSLEEDQRPKTERGAWRRYFNPVKIRATQEHLTKFQRISQIILASYISLKALIENKTPKQAIQETLENLQTTLPYLTEDIYQKLARTRQREVIR